MDSDPQNDCTPFKQQSALVARLKNHDEDAFKELYRSYYGCFVSVLRWYTNDDRKIAKGIEAIVRAIWNDIQDYNCTKGTLLTWVLTNANAEGEKLSKRQRLKIRVIPRNGFNRISIFPSGR